MALAALAAVPELSCLVLVAGPLVVHPLAPDPSHSQSHSHSQQEVEVAELLR